MHVCLCVSVCVCVCVLKAQVGGLSGLMGNRESSCLMGRKAITRSVALSIGGSELFTGGENSNRAHNSELKGSANRTLVPTRDMERALD